MSESKARQQRQVELSEPQSEVMASRAAIIADIAGQGGGKTNVLGLCVGWMVTKFPDAKGFIGANTNMQLQQSTLTSVMQILKLFYGMTEYNKNSNPAGHYVIGLTPPKHWKKSAHSFNRYTGIMSFWNGCRVFLGSLENYKAHDGKQFAWAHLDETKDTKKAALTDVILGRLRQYGLWYVIATGVVIWGPLITPEIAERQGLKAWNPCYIHTSPAEGSVDWLIELLGISAYEKEIRERITNPNDYFYKKIVVTDKENPDDKTETDTIIYSTYHNEHNLPPGFIAKRKSQLSAGQILKYIFGNPFGKNGGEYYPNFDRFKHVTKLSFDPKLPIHTTWDFNAMPYVTCLCAHVEYITRYWNATEKKKYDESGPGLKPIEVLRFRIFREITIPDSTTKSTAERVVELYGKYNPDIYVNGDASGRSRIEGMGTLTQYQIIENNWQGELYLAEGWLRVKKTNINVSPRRDLMNRIWEGKIPEIEIEIDEECVNTIRDCEYLLKGVDGGKHKEKEEDANGIKIEKMGHTSDALEYLVCELCKDFIKE